MSGPARASLESGKSWIRETRRLAGRDLIARVERYSLTTFVHLSTVAIEMGDEVGLDAFLSRISELDPERLRRRLIGGDAPMCRDSLAMEDVVRAASGDAGARRRVRSILADGPGVDRDVDRLLRTDATELRRDLAEILALWATRVFPRWADEATAAIERDADARAELLSRTSSRDVIEAATSGLAFVPASWTREVVVIPSVALRPFVVPAAFDATKLFIVPVSDEAMDPDGVVPTRLVKITSALGDPIRLQALHELAHDDGMTAMALAERLAVERSTLYHHLGILRSAGLVTIADHGDGLWRYQVRQERIDELAGLLRSYLADEH
jgi:DNA-binding transcriptional ArsR family regulator